MVTVFDFRMGDFVAENRNRRREILKWIERNDRIIESREEFSNICTREIICSGIFIRWRTNYYMEATYVFKPWRAVELMKFNEEHGRRFAEIQRKKKKKENSVHSPFFP